MEVFEACYRRQVGYLGDWQDVVDGYVGWNGGEGDSQMQFRTTALMIVS